MAEPPTPAGSAPVLEAARGLGPALRAAADRIETERRLPSDLVDALAAAGIFRLGVPRAFGGEEADPATLVAVIEALSEADGSAGWCAMIAATTSILSGRLREDVAREIYGSAGAVTGGAFAPQGRAEIVDGGYRLSGRWAFASGCEHCTWLLGGAVVQGGGAVDGVPETRLLLFPAGAARVIDTWTVSGLRGTGSHDIAVEEVRVPAAYTVSLVRDPAVQPGPLYAVPVFGLLAAGVAAVALGIGRRAIAELAALAAAKTPTLGRRRLADRGAVQAEVAEAEAVLRAGRAFLLEALGAAWEAACRHGEIGLGERATMRLAATHATASAARAVDLMYRAGGGTAIYATSPLQRCFRDVHTVTQHMLVGPATLELAGRVLLGVPADATML